MSSAVAHRDIENQSFSTPLSIQPFLHIILEDRTCNTISVLHHYLRYAYKSECGGGGLYFIDKEFSTYGDATFNVENKICCNNRSSSICWCHPSNYSDSSIQCWTGYESAHQH